MLSVDQVCHDYQNVSFEGQMSPGAGKPLFYRFRLLSSTIFFGDPEFFHPFCQIYFGRPLIH